MFVGKNLESSLDRWKELIGAVSGCHQDLDWIKDGIRIPFSNLPIDFEIENKHFSARENDFISKELERLLKSGCIVSCKEKPKCVSPISTVPKKDSFRLITDLRRINSHCETRSFVYEDIKSIIDLAEAGDSIVTCDIRNGFFHIQGTSGRYSIFRVQIQVVIL